MISEQVGLVILVGIFTALYVAVRRFYMPPESKAEIDAESNKKTGENQTPV